MGYRKLKNGGYEQPKDALKRVERRSIFNIAAACGVAVVTSASIYCGAQFLPDSPEPINNDQLYQHVPSQTGKDSGLALLCFIAAGLAGTIGGGIAGVRIARDIRSKEKIRQDIQDGIVVDEKGRAILPEAILNKQQGVAPTVTEAAPR